MMQCIDKKKFLDKLTYMGYLDDKDEAEEIEGVADKLTVDAVPKEIIKQLIDQIRDMQTDYDPDNELEKPWFIAYQRCIFQICRYCGIGTEELHFIAETNKGEN